MQLGPYRVSTLSTIPANLSAGVQLPKVSGPSNGVSLAGPIMKRDVQPASVPLSGFLNPSVALAQPEFYGLVSCRNRSWDLPSERSPRKDRAPLSGSAGSPAVIHPRAVTH